MIGPLNKPFCMHGIEIVLSELMEVKFFDGSPTENSHMSVKEHAKQ